MGITVKKKKLTVKTLKAQAPDAAEASEKPAETDAAPDAAAPPAEATAAPAAAIPTAAQPAAAAPAVKPASYVLAGTLAIIATVMFIALIIFQFMEWNFFNDAFPRDEVGVTRPPPSSMAQPLAPADMDVEPLETLD